MNAKEMFEELNLEQIRNDDNYIEYVRNGLGGYISILFSLRWKSIKSAYGYQARGTNYHEISIDELKAIICQTKELGWIEEKAETNYEYFKDEIIENSGYTFALVDGKLCQCSSVSCCNCGFSTGHGCSEKIKEWLKQPREKPVYKLNKFEKELLQCYPDIYSFKVFNSLNGMKEKGYFKGIDDNEIIGDILANCEVIE